MKTYTMTVITPTPMMMMMMMMMMLMMMILYKARLMHPRLQRRPLLQERLGWHGSFRKYVIIYVLTCASGQEDGLRRDE
jgi:hypothetical protein